MVSEATGEILYTVRAKSGRFQPAVYAPGNYTIRIGKDKPDAKVIKGVTSTTKEAAGSREVEN